MADEIFIIHDNRTLVEMKQQDYDSESLLQSLLAEYPKLLAGGQIDSTSPRRWLLIKREMGVPDEEDGGGRWSVDHLFLDQDAIPTLVEVKRGTDPRIRREVVGQMLDYAANAVACLRAETIKAEFENSCKGAEESLAQFLGEDADPSGFWQRVETNLRAGKIRMLFVADLVPPELRRIVEFLNEQMEQAEVLAVEIKQYVGEGMTTIVPRVIGQTAKAGSAKSPGGARLSTEWNKEKFFVDLSGRLGEPDVGAVQRLFDACVENGGQVSWGTGAKGSANFAWPTICPQSVLSVWTDGYVQLRFIRGPDQFRDAYGQLASRLGFQLPADWKVKEPRFPAGIWGPRVGEFLEGFVNLVSRCAQDYTRR
jgi:hypothetical protein